MFSYLGNSFCGSAGRPAQEMASMHFPVFLQEKAEVGNYGPCVLLQTTHFANWD